MSSREPLGLEAAVEFVVAEVARRRPDYSIEQVRTMVELARHVIARDPGGFVDSFLDDIALGEAADR